MTPIKVSTEQASEILHMCVDFADAGNPPGPFEWSEIAALAQYRIDAQVAIDALEYSLDELEPSASAFDALEKLSTIANVAIFADTDEATGARCFRVTVKLSIRGDFAIRAGEGPTLQVAVANVIANVHGRLSREYDMIEEAMAALVPLETPELAPVTSTLPAPSVEA